MSLADESHALISAYRKHVIRCVASEHDRRTLINGLKEGQALIVVDYAMKILPTDAVEAQSAWFAKCGISYHMCAVTARINGQLVSHAFHHVSTVSKQDGAAVAGIFEHALGILAENGVTHVHLRSDCAGTYLNAPLIGFVLKLTKNLKLNVLSYIFSEPGFGKGKADREISLGKGQLNAYIDSGHSATTPKEIITGFTHGVLLKGCLFYLIEVEPLPGKKAFLTGIKQFSSFRFEDGGVRVRRHDAIGQGRFIKEEKLPPVNIKKKIIKKGGYLSQSEHFWKVVGTTTKEAKVVEVKEKEERARSKMDGTRTIYLCSDLLCTVKGFTTESGRDVHELEGKHVYYKEVETMKDFAIRTFSNMVESTEDAQKAVNADSLVPIATGDQSEEMKKGWALKGSDEKLKINPKAKKEVWRLANAQLDEGRRAEAREIRDQLRSMTNADGSYVFTLVQCLTEGQIKNQIKTLLAKRKTNGGKAVVCPDKAEDQMDTSESTKCGRKRKETQAAKTNEAKQKRSRPAKKAQESSEEEDDEEQEETTEYFDSDSEEEPDDDVHCLTRMEEEVMANLSTIYRDDDGDSDEFSSEFEI